MDICFNRKNPIDIDAENLTEQVLMILKAKTDKFTTEISRLEMYRTQRYTILSHVDEHFKIQLQKIVTISGIFKYLEWFWVENLQLLQIMGYYSNLRSNVPLKKLVFS